MAKQRLTHTQAISQPASVTAGPSSFLESQSIASPEIAMRGGTRSATAGLSKPVSDELQDLMNKAAQKIGQREIPFDTPNEFLKTVRLSEEISKTTGITKGTIAAMGKAVKATSEEAARKNAQTWLQKFGSKLGAITKNHSGKIGLIAMGAYIAMLGISAYRQSGKDRIRGAKHELDLQDATLGALTPESAAAGGQADQLSQMNMMLLQGLTGASPPPQPQPPSSGSGGPSQQEMQMLLQALQQR